MKFRLAAAAGVALAAALALPSSAAPAPQVTDQVDDANGISDQGLLVDDPVPTGTPTPVGSQADKDIVSVTFESLKDKGTCLGFTAILELKAAPTVSNALYRIQSVTAANPDGFWLQHRNNPRDGSLTTLRIIGGAEAKTINLSNPAIVNGNKIFFKVVEKDLKDTFESTKTKLEALGADIRVDAAAATAPMFDQAESTATFSVC